MIIWGSFNKLYIALYKGMDTAALYFPSRGGVMTPGVTFANTGIIERLCERGVTFSVEQPQQPL